MKKNPFKILTLAVLFLLGMQPGIQAATYTVTNTNNSGSGSLRQAVLDANANSGLDYIKFNIPDNDPNHYRYNDDGIAGKTTLTNAVAPMTSWGTADPDYNQSWFRISLNSDINITDDIIIEGYSQPGAAPNTLPMRDANGDIGAINSVIKIEIVVARPSYTLNQIYFQSTIDYAEINGICFQGWGYAGTVTGIVRFVNKRPAVYGCFFGIDISGLNKASYYSTNTRLAPLLSVNNYEGIDVGGNLPSARNIFASNWGLAYLNNPVASSLDKNVIGNYFNADRNGNQLFIDSISTNQHLCLDMDGGDQKYIQHNLFASYRKNALEINPGVSGDQVPLNNVISNNIFGANRFGIPNNSLGVQIQVAIDLTGTVNAIVENNQIYSACTLSSGSGSGAITLFSTQGTIIRNNYIGVDPTFTYYNKDNSTTSGVIIIYENPRASIYDNYIYKHLSGIRNYLSDSCVFLRNKVYDNNELGIKLYNSGYPTSPLPNDPLDEDAGSNLQLNYPESVSSILDGNNLTLNFNLDVPAGTYHIEVFANDVADPSLHGEGQRYVGSFILTHPGGGSQNYVQTLSNVSGVSLGDFISMTNTQCTDGTCDAFVRTSEFSGIQPTILPVSFLSFEASKSNNTSVLKWVTSEEVNNRGFEIERSGDAKSWEKLGFVGAKSLTSTAYQLDYNFTDNNPLPGKNYYRLKQVDIDGSYDYSLIRSVLFGKENTKDIIIYPNPVESEVNIDGLSGSETLSLYDATGKLVIDNFPATAANMRISLDKLSPGIYYIRVADRSQGVQLLKFVKN